jgi:hypothetical protein
MGEGQERVPYLATSIHRPPQLAFFSVVSFAILSLARVPCDSVAIPAFAAHAPWPLLSRFEFWSLSHGPGRR